MQKADARPTVRRYLVHLDGLRVLACLWIVTAHFGNPRVPTRLEGVLERGFVAVDFFICLSGFTTHYASAHKPLGDAASVARFHLQRIGRILPLHWTCVVLQMFSAYYFMTPLNVIGSLLLTTAWNCYEPYPDARDAIFSPHQCDFWPFNPLHWTLSTMLFSWLCYPFTRRLVLACRGSEWSRLLLLLLCVLAAQLPALALQRYLTMTRGAHATITPALFNLLYKFPPLRVPSFLVGMAAAQIALDDPVGDGQHQPPGDSDGRPPSTTAAAAADPSSAPSTSATHSDAPSTATPSGRTGGDGGGGSPPSSSSSSSSSSSLLAWRGWAALVDVAALSLLALLLVALPPPRRNGAGAYLIAALDPLFVIVLLGGCAAGATERSWLLRLASAPPLRFAGRYSFHMYLLQELWAKVFLYLQAWLELRCHGWWECSVAVSDDLFHPAGIVHTPLWPPFLASLLGLAVAWCHHVEEPWVHRLKRLLDARLPGHGAAAGTAPALL